MSRPVPAVSGWTLLPDFAVRSAGFPVDGLQAFGGGDESARLRAVAGDPRFQEAVTWQNPAALTNAVRNVAAGAATKPSRARQREEVVASYWQRYCAKNDTIGFFGPLGWGRLADDGPALQVRSGAVVRERAVHLESWGVRALAETLADDLHVADGPHTEDELRELLDRHPDSTVRERGLEALGRLEAARDTVAAAPPQRLAAALTALDATFVELTGRDPVRNHGRAYGARTLAYVDCVRDLDVRVGPGLVADLAPALHSLFEACRWYCGEVYAIGRGVIERAAAECGDGPLGPVMGSVLRNLMMPAPEVGERIDGVLSELHRRLALVVADPDPATVGTRAAAAFGDHRPAWRHGIFSSADVQLAATDAAAVERGDYLAVIGDVHPGGNPLMQGVFANRHPDREAFLACFDEHVGPDYPMLLPPFGPGMGVDARGFPVTSPGVVNLVAMPGARAQPPRRTWDVGRLLLSGHEVVDPSGELQLSLFDVFALPIFISGVRVFELLPEAAHSPRVTLGRCVLRREGWSIPATELPQRGEDIAAFARDRGMPRRVFTKSPLERKPMYLDVESTTLSRILCRQARKAAEASPRARIAFTEMLPGPEACWLTDEAGHRYVSELRIVAVDELSSRAPRHP